MSAGSPRERIESIDWVRGVVMIVMALDHVRDYLQPAFPYAPTDLAHASTALFVTRWITHFCAPVFVFLAGTSALLWRERGGRSGADLSRFLLTRGAWIVVVELTIVRFAWVFDVSYGVTAAGVLWAIGWSMIALAGLARLPVAWCAGVGVAMVALHNLTDGVASSDAGALDWLWSILHQRDRLDIGGGGLYLQYPLVPWIGVMAAGYAFGQVVLFERERRRQWLLWLGVGMTVGFVAVRAIGVYGDPHLWSPDEHRAALAFLNTTKYPPSLQFLLMTLGPMMLLLYAIDGRSMPRCVSVFGRVPMFYYIAHLYLIHLVTLGVAWIGYGAPGFSIGVTQPEPAGWGLSLPWIYATWAAVVIALYPLCAWYDRVKRRSRSPWLSYL